MHHLYPLAKGDPLCPLGFHPQVRWPTRCKRCFRDYKEHGGKKKEEDMTFSTPNLSPWNSSSSRNRDDDRSSGKDSVRGWVSSQNLSQDSNKNDKTEAFSSGFARTSASWTSTPDLGNVNDDAKPVTISFTLPKKRPTPPDTGQNNTEIQSTVVLRRPASTPPPTAAPPKTTPTVSSPTTTAPSRIIITKNDSLAERVKKMQALKARSNSIEKDANKVIERDTNIKKDKPRDVSSEKEKPEKTVIIKPTVVSKSKETDVDFMIKIKSSRNNASRPPTRGGPAKELVNGTSKDNTSDREDSDSNQEDDNISLAGTTTSETTLVDHNQFNAQEMQSLREEVEVLRKRCERVEKEKSDILLRRLAALDTSSSKTTSRPSETLKLQQKINEITIQNEDLRDEKKSLQIRVREIEAEMEGRPSNDAAARAAEQLRSKLLAAETLCEELMDENEDMKRELRSMEEEIEEMQDNFREDQADEYSSLRKELEQTTKNCRVLSFKLKKTERKTEQLEQEKKDQEKKLLELAGGPAGVDRISKIKQLEQELAMSNEVALRLQRELQDANSKLSQAPTVANLKKTPTLGSIGKSQSTDAKPSRASLTRGGSQEDPQQLLRDLQDSLEREADLREQLKNAEEEGSNLRKRASRVEDDNESLALQLKKMATKARTRKLSPTAPTNRLTIESAVEKDEGISDEEDPAELRILLELNEQEASILRRKVEELDQQGESLKTQVKDLTEKLASANIKSPITLGKKLLSTTKGTGLSEEKIKILEDDIAEVRKKLIEKERDVERLHAELSITQKRSKGSLIKSKSLDGANEQQNVDLKRQLQLVEQEVGILRNKIQTLETDNETLQTENKKLQLSRGTKAKSVDRDSDKLIQLETELKEAQTKIKELEKPKEPEKVDKKVTFNTATLKKDADALKTKQEELDKLKISMKKIENEKNQLTETLKQLKDDAIKTFKPRTPKKPTDLTTKLQMKKMVEELENEIGEMFVVMKNADLDKLGQKQDEKSSLEKTIEDLRSKLNINESEISKEKKRLQDEINTLKETNKKYDAEKKMLSEKHTACEKERDQALEKYKNIQESNTKLDGQISKLNADLKSATTKQTAMADCMKKIEDLKKDLEEKDKLVDKLKKELDTAAKTEQDKIKLLKEAGDKAKKILELEKKVKDAEEKSKRSEKMLNVRKERVAKLEKELSEEKEQNDNIVEKSRRLSSEWISERDQLMIRLGVTESKLEKNELCWKEKTAELEGKIVTLESQIAAKSSHIQQLEDSLSTNSENKDVVSTVELAKIKEQLDTAQREIVTRENELSTLRHELTSKQQEATKLQEDLSNTKKEALKLQNDKTELDNTIKAQTKESKHLESKVSELDIDFQAEKKRTERMKVIHEKDLKNKELELASLKSKLRTLEQTSGAGSKKIEELKKEYDEKFKKLENELTVEKKEYDELTSKYELLEEEHVVTKAKLTIEKETAHSEVLLMQRNLANVNSDLKSLQDTYNNKTDAWIKEKIDLQEKLSQLEERLCGGGWEVEKARLTAKLDQKGKEIDHISKERDVSIHLQDSLKRETEELRKKLDDYDKVTKVQRNMDIDKANMEREIKMLQNKLNLNDKAKKSEIAECKLRYESQMQTIQDELHTVQTQIARFKRERDTYKQMLDGAHKTMAEMKTNGEPIIRPNRNSVSNFDELEESKSKIDALQQQIACLEDGLCETRLEASRVRTELVSERSTAEVRLAEMQSKLNEFEEERLISSGRTKIPGLRTRLELAWHKEREEQQRLLQETSTLARDLRQTLFEVERERDKDKLDMKRRIDQLKKTGDEENEESKKKVTELQCDLLELRDAHAKLRTTNEKLRREKERHDREREQHKMSIASLKRSQQDEDRKISYMLDLIDELEKSSGENIRPIQDSNPGSGYLTPTPPRRHRSKSRSREATPDDSIGESNASGILLRLRKVSHEVRASQLNERQRRQLSMRRAVSTEPRDTVVNSLSPRVANGRTSSLKKRSISLEQTTQEQSKIWKTDDDSMSSLQSLDTDIGDNRLYTMQRDTSLDSRLSGGSTQSDILPASEKKKKKGIFGKLKQLTKSRSIDDNAAPDVGDFAPIGSISQGGSDSDMSAAGSKKDLRGRLSGMFSRKSGSNTSVSST
ncbi:uncharacterized protein LOC143917604 isoform X2 [Arctopsyche grandis]